MCKENEPRTVYYGLYLWYPSDFKLYEWSLTVTAKVYPREYFIIQERTRTPLSESHNSVKLVLLFICLFHFNFRTESAAFKI